MLTLEKAGVHFPNRTDASPIMNVKKLLAASVAISAISGPVLAEPVFNRVATFAVAANLPEGTDPKTETSAEIIAATADGMMLVYTDSPHGGIGMIDIADPKAPKAAGYLKLDGEPTSVSVLGATALVAVNTSESFVAPSGRLAVIDLANKTETASCDLGGQPDSVALAPDGSFLAVAIENERDEDVNDGEIPQMPAGYVVTLQIKDGTVDCASRKDIALTGLAAVAAEDPEPEFVAINANGEIAVTLQENNHIAIIDGKTAAVTAHFSAGAVDLAGIDTKRDGVLNFTDSKDGVLREPDSIKWLGTDRLVIANEGDYEGGSRGFTIFSRTGEVIHESGASFEHEVARIGHYPEGRSRSKGVEPEGLETGTFGETPMIFVLAERASVIGVYADTGAEPMLKQILPSGLSPEGVVAISGRNVLAVANEVDLVEDGGVRSHVTIYEYAEGSAQYPTIVSANDGDAPIGWGALSGLTADAEKPGLLYAVSDSIYSGMPSIYTIDATQTPAMITSRTLVTRNGDAAQLLDIEGIVGDGDGGFWLASEGRSDRLVPHALYHVDAEGEIKESIAFPADLLPHEIRFGAEGVTKIGDTLWVAIQREWKDDPEGQVKLLAYNLESKEWGAVRYPLDAKGEGWIGLSEITLAGDHVMIVERDNQIGAAAKVKKLYRVPVAQLVPGKIGGELPLVTKELVTDFMPALAGFGGYILEKVEGFAIDAAGDAFAVTDNDGVDNANGETLLLRLGKL
jgi:alkaline phosphatase